MTDAPEKIWASVAGLNSEGRFGMWDLRAARADNPDWTSYTRTDLCQRLKAMERERCARIVERAGHPALAVEIRAGGQDPTKFDKRAAYMRGLEDAAKVADDMDRRMSAHLDDAVQAKRKGLTDQEWKGIGAGNASIAASRIAAAIRALAKEGGE